MLRGLRVSEHRGLDGVMSGFLMFDPSTSQVHRLMAGSPWPEHWLHVAFCQKCGGRFRDGEYISRDGKRHRECALLVVER